MRREHHEKKKKNEKMKNKSAVVTSKLRVQRIQMRRKSKKGRKESGYANVVKREWECIRVNLMTQDSFLSSSQTGLSVLTSLNIYEKVKTSPLTGVHGVPFW